MNDSASAHGATPLQAATTKLARLSLGVAAASLLGLVVVQGWQVIARYVLNDSPSWTEPVTVLLLSATMAFGAAAGVHEGRHFRFSLLADALSPAWKRVLHVLVQAVTALIGAAIAGSGAVLFLDGLDIRAAGAPIPQSANYLPLAIGGALMTLFALAQLRPLRQEGAR